MGDYKAIGKAQKDVQEILLLGSTEEREALLNELNKNKSLSILEKKVYVCLIHYKNQNFSTAKELIEELIFDIGGLQEQQQAKVYLLKAQIYEKLQGNDITLYKKEIQDSLDKSYQIFRNEKFNQIQFDVHHYLLQIADMYIRQKLNEEGEYIYELIFTQPQNCRYPNDLAIFIQAYLRYFESRLKGNNTIELKLFESCLKTMNEKYLDKVNLHKMLFYKAVNNLLRSNIESSQVLRDEFIQSLRQSEQSYQNKNKIKKNHKMIYFVDQFITADNNQGSIIQMIPIFLKLGEQFKEIVKNRLILLHKEQNSLESEESERIQKQKQWNSERDLKLNEIYQKHKNVTIEQFINEQKEIKGKIQTLYQELKQYEDIQKQNEKLTYIQQKDNLLKLEQLRKQIVKENEHLNKKEQEKLKFIDEHQLNHELQPQEFEIYKKFEEEKQKEQKDYERLSKNEQQNFVRKYTLDQNQIQKILDLSNNLNNNQKNYSEEINQINQYCCFEFIQLEEFESASIILKKINLSPIKTILTLLLFSNIPYELCIKFIQEQIEEKQQLEKQSQDIQIKKIFLKIVNQLLDFNKDKSIQIINLNKIENYANDYQGCLNYLIDDIKNQRFYDPHVYEFKNIIYDIIYNLKGRNSQALLFDGSTYADILNKYKNSWKLEQKQ